MKTHLLALALTGSTLLSSAHPVKPVTVETVPFPEEIQEAITRQSLSVKGEAEVKFHLNAANRVIIDKVDATSVELSHHIWQTIHDMPTQDTSLTSGVAYSVRVRIE